MIVADRIGVRGFSGAAPNLVLLALGKALAQAYDASTTQPLPEPLARLVREIEERERVTSPRRDEEQV
ncbi:MAG TPA: hypothetical protein VIL65_00175 [Beijerinckiaceae bacterium]|jgi:hypothetical protein